MPVDAGRAGERTSFAEVAAKLVDLRGVARPLSFSGSLGDWAEFKFRLESTTSLLGLDELIDKAAKDNNFVVVTEDEIGRSKFVYNILVTLCHGRALALIRKVKRADGVGAWGALVREFEPETAGRYCAMLTSILTPRWTPDEPFMDQMLEWEHMIA